MIWLGKQAFAPGRDYKLKIHTQSLPVRIHEIKKVVDASSVDGVLNKDRVDRHDVADVVLETRQPIAFDDIGQGEATGRFVIVDGYDIAGGGIIIAAEKDAQEDFRAEARLRDFHWIRGGVTAADRAGRFGHRAALVMFVGPAGVGKHKFARALEKHLFVAGKSAYLLDGTNVLLGVDSDLLWKESTQSELVRRFAEVAHLLLDAGLLVVSTTNAIGLADVASVQALIPDFPVLTIPIDAAGAAVGDADLSIVGSESDDEVCRRVADLLRRRQIIES
jgi:bifunctional enzyme CysN/CysC